MTLFVPPRPPTLPAKASLFQYAQIGLRSALSMFLEGSYETTAVGRIRLPTLPKGELRSLFIVRTPELLREVLIKSAADFPKSQLMGSMLKELLGEGIFISNGALWRRQRRMMEPALEGARIRDVFPMMLRAAEASADRLDAHLAGRKAGKPVAMDVETTHFTADIIFRTIFSEPIAPETAHDIFKAFQVFQDIGYAHGFLRMVRFPTELLPGAGRGRRAARRIRGHLKHLLDQRVAAVARGETVPDNDILASLMAAVDPDAGTHFDETELLDQIAVMFLAGHETSASTLAWATYLLASCPHLQDRVHAEAVEVLGDRAPSFADMKKLAFTRDVVRETLRLYPPVAFVARDSSREEKLGTRDVPPGSVVFVPLWLLHRHKSHWHEPDAFDPDRFESSRDKEAIQCAYLPFSMGPRVCPGAAFALQETSLFLALLARRFRFKPAPGHTPQPVSRLTLRSLNGIRLIVERR